LFALRIEGVDKLALLEVSSVYKATDGFLNNTVSINFWLEVFTINWSKIPGKP
jgi:hypothetical protein